jgi:hypothetical protein
MTLNLELRQSERELKGKQQELQKIEAQASTDANKVLICFNILSLNLFA